ncbi:MAG TPA: hypothetical protein VL172_09725 [Kofleriaceae bacterium]|nr:hypothetical protein [Kofleriaceae bacterium]
MRWNLLGLILVLARPGLAAAEETAEPLAFYPRASIGVGCGLWLGDVAGLTPSGAAARVEGDWQVAPGLFVNGGWDLASVHDDDDTLAAPVAATVNHGSLGLRHAVFSFGAGPTALGGDLFVRAALGREWTRWERGGKLARTTLSLGLGGTIVLPRHDRSRPFALIRYGMRFLFARAPDPGKVPLTCDAPCEELTRTRPYDKSMLLEIGGSFGR